jgi:hypothetical protein
MTQVLTSSVYYPYRVDQRTDIMKNPKVNKTMMSDPNIHIPAPKLNNAPIPMRVKSSRAGPYHPSRLESLIHASEQKPMSRLDMTKKQL